MQPLPSDFTAALECGAEYDHPEHGRGVVVRSDTGWLARLAFESGEHSVVKSRLVPVAKPDDKLPISPKARERVLERRAAANDNNQSARSNAPPMSARTLALNPANWHGKPLPEREWYCPGLIPMRQVTILNGDGGVGKSLLALQIAAAGAMSLDTLDMEPLSGKTLYIGAEDEADEFQRRLHDIAKAHGKELDFLFMMRLIPLADRDALLAVPDRSGNMQPTPLWQGIEAYVAEHQPKLVVLDTAADLFGGDEIKRGQVRQFIGMLRKMAIEKDCAIILLAHPSLDGIRNGTGSSGSTAWNNSVRSRLYLTKDKDDKDLRILTTMKANYGETGAAMRMRWRAGAFVLDDGKPSATAGLLNRRADEVFLDVLSKLNRQGQRLSPNPSATHAPKVIAAHADAGGVSKKALTEAQQRLLDAGSIRIVEEGPPSRRYRRLLVTSEIFGEEAA